MFDKKTPKIEPSPLDTESELEVERFYRIMEMPLSDGDNFRGYQVEEIAVCQDIVVARKAIDRPNLFEYAQTHAVDLMDPRNLSNTTAGDVE